MERRQHPRKSVLSQVAAFADEQQTTVVMMDISRNGARILLPVGAHVAVGDKLAVKMGAMPTVIGKAVRLDGRVVGLEFGNVLHSSMVASAKRLCEEGRAEGQLVVG